MSKKYNWLSILLVVTVLTLFLLKVYNIWIFGALFLVALILAYKRNSALKVAKLKNKSGS